mgnify:CR=1 FL=1
MLLTTQILTGPDVTVHLDALATLRLEIFREFPYLYDGTRDNELRYLQVYAQAADSCVLTVAEEGRVVGAATGIPLLHEQQEIREPFAAVPYPPDSIYYVGELLLYPAYRNRGLGMQLLSNLEVQIRSLGSYRYLTCATVVRPDDHPQRPANYLLIERFLKRTGFIALPEVTATFAWRETDGVSREHLMQFWIKVL